MCHGACMPGRQFSARYMQCEDTRALSMQALHYLLQIRKVIQGGDAGRAPAARTAARPLVRLAMRSRPSGPWYTAYMAAMLASSACAVQMLEVALSRRMCCSRVCIAMRSAGLPCASLLTPAPGNEQVNGGINRLIPP